MNKTQRTPSPAEMTMKEISLFFEFSAQKQTPIGGGLSQANVARLQHGSSKDAARMVVNNLWSCPANTPIYGG